MQRGDGRARGDVVGLRQRYGFPGADWDAHDDAGLVLLAYEGGRPIGSARATLHHAADGAPYPYFTPELTRYLPTDPRGFLFVSRLVVAPGARSLEVLAVLIHAGVLAARQTWDADVVAGIALPQLVRLYGWLGCKPVSPAAPLAGLDLDALLVAGDLATSDARACELIEPRGWEVTVPTLVG
ncbi:N-acyl amino acid synthase FeeM domain-containing protein [Embleya sp. NBC_00896]|uniref:N-acyl amino acid synthase FeeM domain-containing protein n=1 Tax=Embleya sp. NBC_00896 TaxID=2975961 RepID=UPI00386387F8|nr:hypothetical protein OG928_22400 [Embleya sp. NBC_00896]